MQCKPFQTGVLLCEDQDNGFAGSISIVAEVYGAAAASLAVHVKWPHKETVKDASGVRVIDTCPGVLNASL